MTPSKKRARGRILTEKGLKKIQDAVYNEFLDRYTFQAISDLTNDAGNFVSTDTVSRIWAQEKGADKSKIKSLFKAFGLKLDEDDHILALESHTPSDSLGTGEGAIATPLLNPSFVGREGAIATPLLNPSFVGREGAIAHLNACIGQGAKVIIIQAAGGVGKTTLARQYLHSQGFDLVLELLMAKEKENITPIESAIEEWLKRDFQEEPGREFGITLDRLKRQLQTRRVGVLIDNLEPALDKQGKFIEAHRRYVELLRVLADLTVQSVTLITSRERLCESGVAVEHYRLPGLDEKAWQAYFSRKINSDINIDVPTLKTMCNVYGGNAKAMEILYSAIREDFDGDMVAYWRENSGDPLIKGDLEDLVISQFNRLQQLDPDAYRLLCRLGCYRYQDVPTVPTEGLLCLLWDVPEVQRRRVIEALRNRSLVECQKGEHSLHPAIRAEAIARLQESENWETANRKAADFWTKSVKTVETIKDAVKALEAYHHCWQINEFEEAANVILNRRINKWVEYAPLGVSLYRLGLLKLVKTAIELLIIKNISSCSLSKVFNILGDLYWIIGSLEKAIQCHRKADYLASELLKSFDSIKTNYSTINELNSLKVASQINIGLCKIDMGELEEAIISFNDAIIISQNNEIEPKYINSANFCMAFLYSYLGFTEKTLFFLKKISLEIKQGEWGTGYRLLFIGLAYKNLGETKRSVKMLCQAISYAEESHYTQVKAKALTGLAEIYREQGDFEKAFLHHSESIEILDKIGAKCDLAEAYYQLALTYQKMEDIALSQENFDKAIQLFTEMEAPKQIERVRNSIQNP